MDKSLITAVQVEPGELLQGLRQSIRESGVIYKFRDSETLISNELEKTLKETERKLTEAEIAQHAARLYNKIATRSVKFGLLAYSRYAEMANRTTTEALLKEKHRPQRMARYMSATGAGKKPPNKSCINFFNSCKNVLSFLS